MILKYLLGVFVMLIVSKQTLAEPSWTSLRVTWGINIFSSRVFSKLPRTESKARTEGYTKINDECASGKFRGYRYIKDSDTAAIVIYDVNGYIAGIQQGIPKTMAERVNANNSHPYSFENSPAYQLDTVNQEQVYFMTAYFVNPRIICSEGRTEEQYEEQGTGTGLYLQNGTDPIHDSLMVPLYESGMESTQWVKGGCFRSMGIHYWYNTSENMDCQYFFPYTIIYNRGKITSFAFASIGNFDFSRRFEHPPSSSFETFLPTPVPKCLYEINESAGGFSTMHVYFSVRPWNIFC